MFHGNPYDNVMIEAVHELHQGLRVKPAPINLFRHISLFLRQRRAVTRLQRTQYVRLQAADRGVEV
jgi:hypothetical protein